MIVIIVAAVAVDAIILIANNVGNGEIEDLECICGEEIEPLTDACITFCTGDINPADPLED
jgi:hypothetical protein